MFKIFYFFLSSALFLRSLSRIRIRIWDPHLECGSRMQIQETKIMRIHADADADADADPQHWFRKFENLVYGTVLRKFSARKILTGNMWYIKSILNPENMLYTVRHFWH